MVMVHMLRYIPIASRITHQRFKFCLLNHNLRFEQQSTLPLSLSPLILFILVLCHHINIILLYVYNFINEMGDIPQLIYTLRAFMWRSFEWIERKREERVSAANKEKNWLRMKMKRKTKPVFNADSHTLLVFFVANMWDGCCGFGYCSIDFVRQCLCLNMCTIHMLSLLLLLLYNNCQ